MVQQNDIQQVLNANKILLDIVVGMAYKIDQLERKISEGFTPNQYPMEIKVIAKEVLKEILQPESKSIKLTKKQKFDRDVEQKSAATKLLLIKKYGKQLPKVS